MSSTDPTRNKYDNITLNIPTPEGTANIIFVESQPGVIIDIFYTIGKAGSGVNAWAFALARMVVMALKSNSLADVLAELSNISSSRWAFSPDGVPCRSGPEALYLGLLKYRNIYKNIDVNQKVKYDEESTPPRMRN